MSFNSVTIVRPYEQIIQQIQDAIRGGQLSRGAKLPTERELGEQFGVSRGVVREAIKALDAMGLVESRQGSGIFVRDNPIETVSRAFVLSVSPDAESVDRLFEFRQALEMEAARLAAIRRADDDVEEMNEALNLVDASTPADAWEIFSLSDTRLHRAIATASGNPYLRVAVDAARAMQHDVVTLFARHSGMMQVAIGHHRAIVDAIGEGDAPAASQRMGDHIAYTARTVQAAIPPSPEPARTARGDPRKKDS